MVSGGFFVFFIIFFLSAVTNLIFGFIVDLINLIGDFLLRPFDFSTDMFTAMFGGAFLNNLENIIISAGISISVLLLVFNLLKVFTGRLNDDVPNPFMLVGKFVFAVMGCYWVIPVTCNYLFPFTQSLFNKVLNISTSGKELFKIESGSSLGTLSAFTNGGLTTVNQPDFDIGALFSSIFALIFIIAAVINMFKLVAENAERYFTINTLVLAGPLAFATTVSEKSSQIFKSWFQALLANMVTVIFNIVGFKMILFAFNNCFEILTTADGGDDVNSIVALISLVAISRMAQKFDQLISQIVFKINPIKNRSMLLGALATVGAIDKGAKSLTGKTARDNIKSLAGRFGIGKKDNVGDQGPINNIDTNDRREPLARDVHTGVSENLRNSLGLGENSTAKLNSNPTRDEKGNTRLDASEFIGACKDKNGGRPITAEQAGKITSAVNSSLKDDFSVIGYDSDNQEFILGKASGHGENQHSLTQHATNQNMAALMNGDSSQATVTLPAPRGSEDTQASKRFNDMKSKGYYYTKNADGSSTFYTGINTRSE